MTFQEKQKLSGAFSLSFDLGVGAIQTTSSHYEVILQKSSFEELGYSTGQKYLTSAVKLHKTKILMCVLLLVSLLQKSSFRVLQCSSVYKNVSSDFAFPQYLHFMRQNRAKKQTLPFQFQLSLITRPFLALVA